jgi:DNA polymerase III alpha subunit
LVKHNTGVYLHRVPLNAVENLCSVPYEQAEEQGYFKIDFLNVGIYKGIKDEAHLLELMNHEPLWDLLEDDSFTDLLFHINGHGNILRQMKPKSVEQLAAILAVIRPAKRYLIGKAWVDVLEEVWQKPEKEEYYFKKSHATAYAMAIVVQMNLICEQISYGYN